MPLKALLRTQRIAILVDPVDRGALLDAAARLLADATDADTDADADAERIGASLRGREQLASTAIGHGVAIPHGRMAGLETSRAAFLRVTKPVDFGAADGAPVDLVLALAVPEHYAQQHLQQLAEVAEHFARPEFRAALRAADSVAELGRCLRSDDRRHAA